MSLSAHAKIACAACVKCVKKKSIAAYGTSANLQSTLFVVHNKVFAQIEEGGLLHLVLQSRKLKYKSVNLEMEIAARTAFQLGFTLAKMSNALLGSSSSPVYFNHISERVNIA